MNLRAILVSHPSRLEQLRIRGDIEALLALREIIDSALTQYALDASLESVERDVGAYRVVVRPEG